MAKIRIIDEGVSVELPPVVTIDATVSKNKAKVGDIIDVTASFSDKTINFPNGSLYVTIVNREGQQIKNIGLTVIDGEGTGQLLVEKPIDHLVTNAAINYWKQEIPNELRLVEELLVRVKD